MASTHELPAHQQGTARLLIVAPVIVLSFFYANVLDYCLPLYLNARASLASSSGETFSSGVWADLMTYRVTPWMVGPLLAGLLARWYGEKKVWCAALIGKLCIPLSLGLHPPQYLIGILAFWQGLTGAVMWIAGISLVQMVPDKWKGTSNAVMFASLGLGSFFGPLFGRLVLYREAILNRMSGGDWSGGLRLVFNFDSVDLPPRLEDFSLIFWILAATTTLCGIVLGLWGQRPGRFERDEPATWENVKKDFLVLCTTPKFVALVTVLCLFGGPVFGASNIYLPFRAEEVGFITAGGGDDGWIWLQLLKPFMWILGGLAVGQLAGRRASGLAAVLMMGSFSLTAMGIGVSQLAWHLFVMVAVFEFARQFMRWSHGGYMTEHLPGNLRATAIGLAITFSGLGETIYAWYTKLKWPADAVDFHSGPPIMLAGVLGILSVVGLYLYDRIRPIREPSREQVS